MVLVVVRTPVHTLTPFRAVHDEEFSPGLCRRPGLERTNIRQAIGGVHRQHTGQFRQRLRWCCRGRFGLVELDPATQQRTPRGSASLFGEICRANAITEDIVGRYAPEALESIFGLTEKSNKVVSV